MKLHNMRPRYMNPLLKEEVWASDIWPWCRVPAWRCKIVGTSHSQYRLRFRKGYWQAMRTMK